MIFTTILTCLTKLITHEVYKKKYAAASLHDFFINRSEGPYFFFNESKLLDFLYERNKAIENKKRYFGHYIIDINTIDVVGINIKRNIIKSFKMLKTDNTLIIDEYLIDLINDFEKNEIYCFYPTTERFETVKYEIFFNKKRKNAFINFLKGHINEYELKTNLRLSNTNSRQLLRNCERIYNLLKYHVAKNILAELENNIVFFEEQLDNVKYFINHENFTFVLN